MQNCYKVIVKLTDKATRAPVTHSYEVLAENSQAAEEAVLARHHKDWEAGFDFEAVQAVFPFDKEPG